MVSEKTLKYGGSTSDLYRHKTVKESLNDYDAYVNSNDDTQPSFDLVDGCLVETSDLIIGKK